MQLRTACVQRAIHDAAATAYCSQCVQPAGPCAAAAVQQQVQQQRSVTSDATQSKMKYPDRLSPQTHEAGSPSELAAGKTLDSCKTGSTRDVQPCGYRSVRYWSKEINWTRTGPKRNKFLSRDADEPRVDVAGPDIPQRIASGRASSKARRCATSAPGPLGRGASQKN